MSLRVVQNNGVGSVEVDQVLDNQTVSATDLKCWEFLEQIGAKTALLNHFESSRDASIRHVHKKATQVHRADIVQLAQHVRMIRSLQMSVGSLHMQLDQAEAEKAKEVEEEKFAAEVQATERASTPRERITFDGGQEEEATHS